MKITRIDVFRFEYTTVGGSLVLSGGRVARGQDSTIVKVSTDEGLVGWGEECPFSPTYMVAFADGARAAIREMGPSLLGADPRQIELIYARMDGALQGHAYAKSALDMACWDLLGQWVELPISDLLGGTFQPEFPLYTMVSVGSPERMREEACRLLEQGYRRALGSRCRRHSRAFPEGLSTRLLEGEQRRPERPFVHADAQPRAAGHHPATALGPGRPLRQLLVDVHVDERPVQ